MYCTISNFKLLLIQTLMALLRRDAVNYRSIPGTFAGESGSNLEVSVHCVLACVAWCWPVAALPVCTTPEC